MQRSFSLRSTVLNLSLKHQTLRILMGALLAAATLALLIPCHLDDPGQALQTTIVSALAADDPLLEAALDQYPTQAPAIVITYGQLPLFREQLKRFGPQVVPIVAAYQNSFTTADVLQLAREAWQALLDLFASWHAFLWPLAAPAADSPQMPAEAADSAGEQAADDEYDLRIGHLTREDRGLIALLNMHEEGNAFVGQWEIDKDGEAKRIPSRLVTLAAPELLFGGLTALERRIFQDEEIEWQTYKDAIVDVAAIASGVALLRLLKAAPTGIKVTRDVTKVVGIKAIQFTPIALGVLMIGYPGVFTHTMWVLFESLGLPGILGPIIGWSIVIVPLAFVLSWALLSVRLLRFVARLLARLAWGCQVVAGRLAAAGEERSFRAGAQRTLGAADRL